MKKIRTFASRQPLIFVILVIVISLVIRILAFLLLVLFQVDQANPIVGPIANLAATLFLVFLLWSFDWVKAAGVASWGQWKGWIAAFILLTYYLVELTYSFFGEFSFSVPSEAVSGLALPSVFIAAFFEEILFRGVILYALVSVWGSTRRGLLQAAAVSSFLYGAIHGLNAFMGDPSEALGQIAIALFEGIWFAAIVLRWGSIWPTVLLHVVPNWVLRTKALSIPDFYGTSNSYILAVLFGLPLVVWGVWLILRIDLGQQPDDSTPVG